MKYLNPGEMIPDKLSYFRTLSTKADKKLKKTSNEYLKRTKMIFSLGTKESVLKNNSS